MKEVNDRNFDEVVLQAKTPVIIDLYAQWCAPCRMIAPILEELSNENKDIEFVKCDVDESPEIAKKYNIRNIPAVMYFNNGELLHTQIGAAPKTSFLSKIENLYKIKKEG